MRPRQEERDGDARRSGPAGQRSRNAIAQNRSLAHKSVAWCPGRESYATTDTTDRCLSLAWWRECLARWRRFANRETHYRVAGPRNIRFLRLVESVVPRLVA